MIGEDDDELDELADFIGELEAKESKTREPEVAVTIVPLVPEFRCLRCGYNFSRKDCGDDSKGTFASIKNCPRKDCKSELVIRQKESGWAAERKYDVSVEDAILGVAPNRWAKLTEKRMILSGKIKRRKP